MQGFFIVIAIIVLIIILNSIRQINEYEKGILFEFGKYKKQLNPGWHIVLPIIQSFQKVDVRTKAVLGIPVQDRHITKS